MQSLDRIFGRNAHLNGIDVAVDIQLLNNKTEVPALDFATSQDRPRDSIRAYEFRRMRLQESGAIDQLAVFCIDLKIIAGMFNGVGLVHFLPYLSEGTLLGLGLQEVLLVVDLLFEAVVDQVIQIMPQDQPHARAE